MKEREYYRFFADDEELKWFYDYCVPRIDGDSVAFWSLSARNKILDQEERKLYQLGRSEMIHKTVIRKNGFSFFTESLYGAECNVEGMLTKARVPYPQKVLRLYWNLNLSSVRRVLFEQQRLINECNSELVNAALKRSDAAIDSAFHKIRRIFDSTLSLYSRCSSDRMWMDFEIDIDEATDSQKVDFVEAARASLVELLGRGGFIVVSSPGGFHFPVKKARVKFDPTKIVDAIKTAAEKYCISAVECIRNENEMICLPSTYAYDAKGREYVIRVLNKEDFTEEDVILKP